ncbi:GNAT family N-acetyltransferase [Rubrivivax sp. RP6-9]|uniref:GNAT family N-acetyltransferase n=1 Tax=Rubrivivax sp. RP6-9 TaxID=3415750 RepID=UPI003CC6D6CF
MNWTFAPASNLVSHVNVWDGLARQYCDVVFMSSSFLLPLIDELGNGDEILALCRQGDRLIAGAILYQPRFGFWKTFKPSQLPLGAWLSDSGDVLPELTLTLLRTLPGIALKLDIGPLDPRLMARLPQGPYWQTQSHIITSHIEIQGTYEDYWNSRSKSLRQNCRTQRNRLRSSATDAALECLTERADIMQALLEYGQLETSGWKGKAGTAIRAGTPQGRFYERMLEGLCELGQAIVFRYRIGGRPVAIDLCIRNERELIVLKITYDESMEGLSPAALMRQDQLRWLWGDSLIKRIEFYGRTMEWTKRWTDQERTLYYFSAFRSKGWMKAVEIMRRLKQLLNRLHTQRVEESSNSN